MRATLLLVPLVEAFALPELVERAELQKPHAEYAEIPATLAHARITSIGLHIHKASTGLLQS